MAASPGATAESSRKDVDRVELILSRLEQLPTLPAVAVRVLQATTSPDSSAADVVALIEADQALTARILSLVRRSHLGVRGDLTTVSRAVAVLGFARVRSAVLSIQVYQTFAQMEPGDGSDLDHGELWKHSLAVACAAKSIAREAGGSVAPDEAFVCGLLHDMGKVALDACLPKSYARVVGEAEARRACICDVERSVLGLDHTVAGKRLARHWKLPESIVECVWLHHQSPDGLPASITSAPLVEIVHLADELVRRQRIGYSGYNRSTDVRPLAERLGLDDQVIGRILEELGPQVEEYAGLLGIDGLTSSGLYARALAAANEELGRLNADLVETNRRLAVRARCFDALRGFQGQLTSDGRIVDVCRAAATAARRFLEVEGPAVCFSINQAGTAYHLGSTLTGHDATDVLLVDVPGEVGSLPSTGVLIQVPESFQPVVARFTSDFGGRPVWMWPIRHLSRLAGGVLVACETEEVAALGAHVEELEALSGAFGLALATAVTRAATENLVEELAEVNRRLQSAQDEVLRAKSLSMIAAMASGAAHELNNPLAVISGRAQMLAAASEDPSQQQTLGTIHEQAQRASDIVSELLAFAKPDPPQAETVSLLPWFEAFRHGWLDRSSLEPARLVVTIGDPALTVRVDPGQFERIFENLLANALEATTPENTRLVINSASRASDETVVISVEDNGRGMAPTVLDHALDPFFSHRSAGRGRGLGLSLAYSLALANGGRLWLDSKPEVGTTAYVELPAVRTD